VAYVLTSPRAVRRKQLTFLSVHRLHISSTSRLYHDLRFSSGESDCLQNICFQTAHASLAPTFTKYRRLQTSADDRVYISRFRLPEPLVCVDAKTIRSVITMSGTSQSIVTSSEDPLSSEAAAICLNYLTPPNSSLELQNDAIGHHNVGRKITLSPNSRFQSKLPMKVTSGTEDHTTLGLGITTEKPKLGPQCSSVRRRRGPERSGKEYWAPWVPAKDGPVQSLHTSRIPLPKKDSTSLQSSMRSSSAGERRLSLSLNPNKQTASASYSQASGRQIHSHQYSLPVDSRHLESPPPQNGSQNLRNKNHNRGPGQPSRNIRSPSQTFISPPNRKPLSPQSAYLRYSRLPVPDNQFLGARPEYPVRSSRAHLTEDRAGFHSSGDLWPSKLLSPSSDQSINSSNSSRSESRANRNYSYPNHHPSTSDNLMSLSPEVNGGRFSSYYDYDIGIDGQIDRPGTGYTMGRSKSSSADYSTQALRQLHSAIGIDVTNGGSIGRTRPPLTSRTSTQYSRLDDTYVYPAPSVSRRASYSSATGINPLTERYLTNFPAVPLQSQPLSKAPSSHSQRALIDNTRTYIQVDGTLNSPTRGPGSVPESPVVVPYPPQFIPSPIERKRVDDFDFLNTIESAPRPYTPDRFVFEAGMLNLNKETSTTRNSSQRSKRSLSSFGALSRRSTGASYMASQSGQPPPLPSAASADLPTRNVLKKKNPSLKQAQTDGLDFINFDHYNPSPESNGFIRRSLKSLRRSKEYDTRPLDIPHTASTTAGPSRTHVRETCYVFPDDSTGNATPHSKSRFKFPRLFLKEKFKEIKDKSTPTESSGRTTVPKRYKRSNTFSHPAVPTKDSTTSTTSEAPGRDQFSESRIVSRSEPVSPITPGSTTSMQSFASSTRIVSNNLSWLYREGKVILQQVWNEGWAAAIEDIKDRRKSQRALSGQKKNALMSGALPDGALRSGSKKINFPWTKHRNQKVSPSESMRSDTSVGPSALLFDEVNQEAHAGPSTTSRRSSNRRRESSVRATRSAEFDTTEKRSRFTELLERTRLSRERTRESSRSRR
jgi:hypothetical protein